MAGFNYLHGASAGVWHWPSRTSPLAAGAAPGKEHQHSPTCKSHSQVAALLCFLNAKIFFIRNLERTRDCTEIKGRRIWHSTTGEMFSDPTVLLCHQTWFYFTKPPEHSVLAFKPSIFKRVSEIFLKDYSEAAAADRYLFWLKQYSARNPVVFYLCWESLQWRWSTSWTQRKCLHWCLTLWMTWDTASTTTQFFIQEVGMCLFPKLVQLMWMGTEVSWKNSCSVSELPKECAGAKHLVVPSVSHRSSVGSCRNASLMDVWRRQGRFVGFSAEHRDPRDGPDLLSWMLCKHNRVFGIS